MASERDLRMTHLEGGLSALREEVEATVKPKVAESDMDSESYTFAFSYKDARGKLWEGTFTNNILTIEQQSLVAVMRARLQGGQPTEAIDVDVRDLNLALAHMTYSLAESRPAWANNFFKLRDTEVIFALWAKVRAHELRYFRRDEGP